MIDFRYHLISIVAVLLALGVGLVVGSGFIGGPLLEDVQNRADDIRESNSELRAELEERAEELSRQADFAEEAQPYILGDSLRGVSIVLVEVEGVSGAVVETVIAAIETARGQVGTTIELHDRLALDDAIESDELALILGSVQEEAEALRMETASTLGTRLAAAAEASEPGGERGRAQRLLDALEEAGFVSVTRSDDSAPLVPPGAAFVLVSGASQEPPFAVGDLFGELSLALARRGHAVVVGETLDSEWGVIPSLLESSETRAAVATASGIELPSGSAAGVMALDRAREGTVEHLGLGEGATAVLPQPRDTPPPE